MWFSASFLGNWKEVLLKQIDPDQLPVYWGGTKTDPDGNEMCTSLVNRDIIYKGAPNPFGRRSKINKLVICHRHLINGYVALSPIFHLT